MRCNKCDKDVDIVDFRKRKMSSGKVYRIKTCIYCEREQKRVAENKRYSNFTEEQRRQHNLRSKEYRQKDNYKKWRRVWQKEREKNEPKYLLKRRFSALVRSGLKGGKGGTSVFTVLDYTIEELKRHLEGQFESWMSWDNYGRYNSCKKTWQIDHIRPVSSFNFTSIEDFEFKECWKLSNLRPLETMENIKKRDKWKKKK